MSKEGCARVVLSKMANITYSYTVETGIFPYQNKQPISPPNNTNFVKNEYALIYLEIPAMRVLSLKQ